MKICLVAAPLIARSGVYNSAAELVTAARDAGHPWSAVIGVSSRAGGDPSKHPDVTEFPLEPSGVRGVLALSRDLSTRPQVREADLVVSLVPQSDMALSLTGRPWVAYLRGLPWPDRGETSAIRAALWRCMELGALYRAREVWATTPLLARSVGPRRVDRIVPPGLVPPESQGPSSSQRLLVWAARYSRDKNPSLFIDALRGSADRGVMYGSGPLEAEIAARAPSNVTVAGWVPRDEIWKDARAYLGTSTREAFGRSAVEAAMLGIPVVLSDSFGCAEMLYSDPELKRLFVLPITAPEAWREAVQLLTRDDTLHTRVSRHLQMNARRLTIESAVSNVAKAADDVVRSTSSTGSSTGHTKRGTGG